MDTKTVQKIDKGYSDSKLKKSLTRRNFLNLSMAGTGALGATLASPMIASAATAKSKPIDIKMYEFLPETVNWHPLVFVFLRDAMETVTEGRVKPVLYPPGSICDLKTTYDSVVNGIADWGLLLPGIAPGRFPLCELIELPGLFPNMAIGSLVMMELYEMFPEFEKEFEGVKFLSIAVMMPADLHTTMPIRKLDELKGKKIACQGRSVAKALEALGVSVMLMTFSEMYMAGQRGIIDGVVCAWGSVRSWKLNEVFKYHTELKVNPASLIQIMNPEKWNKIKPADQKAIELICRYATPRQMNIGNKTTRVNIIESKITKELGHEMIYLSKKDKEKAKELYQPIWNEWSAGIEKKGMPGKKMVKTAEKLVKEYIES